MKIKKLHQASLCLALLCGSCPTGLGQLVTVGNWTWIGGSDQSYQLGNYGKLGEPAPINCPGARFGHSMSMDSSRRLIYVFGGTGIYGNLHTAEIPSELKYIHQPGIMIYGRSAWHPSYGHGSVDRIKRTNQDCMERKANHLWKVSPVQGGLIQWRWIHSIK